MASARERRAPGSWRERDLRGRPETRPPSIQHVVLRTARALGWARFGEGVLFGCAAAFGLVATAVISGVPRNESELLILAGLGLVLAATSWRHEHRKPAGDIARALDTRLRFSGALFTAYEIELRVARMDSTGTMDSMDSMGELERHVCERVLERLRTVEALRAMFPPLVLPIAAPVLAAAFLILTLEEARPEEAVDVDVAELSSGMVAAVGALGSDALNAREEGTLSAAEAEELMAVYNGLKDLERRLEKGRRIDSGDKARTLDDLEALEHDLARLALGLEADSELRGRLETARNYLDAIRSGLAESSGPEPRPSPGDELAGAAGAPGADSSRSIADPPSTEVGREGTIMGSSSPTGPPTTPTGTDPAPRDEEPTSEFVGAGRFWPESYDRLITGWVEARSRALEETTD